MAMKTLIDRLCRAARDLRSANGANVTVTFELATIPMVGFVGAAVDYSHANSVKAAMQAAADSTALMVSKEAASLTNAALQTKANDFFKALFTRPEATGLTVTATYNANTGSGSQVVVNAASYVKANFMGLMGVTQMRVAVDAQVKWGNTKMRVALVLDTTGSMNEDGKISALKTATKSLLDQLKAAAATNGDVYVSIIPFSKDVNVGKSNYNASWIDWTDWNNINGDCSKDTRWREYG
jgi:Flp pilus assembly protein TadG